MTMIREEVIREKRIRHRYLARLGEAGFLSIAEALGQPMRPVGRMVSLVK